MHNRGLRYLTISRATRQPGRHQIIVGISLAKKRI